MEIVAENNVSDWQEIVDFASAVDTNNITEEEGGQINSYGFTAEGLLSQIVLGESGTLSHSLVTAPTMTLSAYISGMLTASAIMAETEKVAMTDELYKISIPTLLLWGKYDFVVPPALGESAFANISSTEKELVIFDYSGHSPMDTEAARFVDEVVEFVELYK